MANVRSLVVLQPQPPGARRSVTETEEDMRAHLGEREQLGLFAERLLPPEAYDRPKTRGDCLPGGVNELRPCVWASCKHHLAFDVNEDNGNLRHNFPGVDIADMAETCALDVADRGDCTLEEVGEAINTTREAVRQLEVRAFALLNHDRRWRILRVYVDQGRVHAFQPSDDDEELPVPQATSPRPGPPPVKRYPERVGMRVGAFVASGRRGFHLGSWKRTGRAAAR